MMHGEREFLTNGSNVSAELSYPAFPSSSGSSLDLAGLYLHNFFIYVCLCTAAPLGLVGNGVSLLVIVRKSRRCPAFSYQIGVLVCDIACLVCAAQYALTLEALQLRYNVDWSRSLRKNRVFAHYVAGFVTFAPNTTLTASLVYTVCLTGDRLYALYQPLSYSLLPHRRRTWGLVAGSGVFALLVDAYLVRRLVAVWSEAQGAYVLYDNLPFLKSPLGSAATGLLLASKSLGVIALSVLVAFLSRKYRQLMAGRRERKEQSFRRRSIANLPPSRKPSTTSEASPEADCGGPVKDATLTAVLIAQILFTIAGNIVPIVWYVVLASEEHEKLVPYHFLLAQLVNIVIAVPVCCHFLIYWSISREFRNSVWLLLGVAAKRRSGTALDPTSRAGQ